MSITCGDVILGRSTDPARWRPCNDDENGAPRPCPSPLREDDCCPLPPYPPPLRLLPPRLLRKLPPPPPSPTPLPLKCGGCPSLHPQPGAASPDRCGLVGGGATPAAAAAATWCTRASKLSRCTRAARQARRYGKSGRSLSSSSPRVDKNSTKKCCRLRWLLASLGATGRSSSACTGGRGRTRQQQQQPANPHANGTRTRTHRETQGQPNREKDEERERTKRI